MPPSHNTRAMLCCGANELFAQRCDDDDDVDDAVMIMGSGENENNMAVPMESA